MTRRVSGADSRGATRAAGSERVESFGGPWTGAADWEGDSFPRFLAPDELDRGPVIFGALSTVSLVAAAVATYLNVVRSRTMQATDVRLRESTQLKLRLRSES